MLMYVTKDMLCIYCFITILLGLLNVAQLYFRNRKIKITKNNLQQEDKTTHKSLGFRS